jgi:predicted AAA+ superfamily ATPase
LDKSEILAILNDWNYWNKELPSTKKRDFYDKKISNFLKNDEVIVIKGIRRSGKSTLMINQIKKLVDEGISINDILIINLEDPRFINNLNLELLQTIKDTYIQYLNPTSRPYIFLDEIQNIPQWEKWINKEYELKLSHLIITGSNSSMLSSEIASSLSGRYLSIDVYPLSFKEYLEFKNITINSLLDLVDNKIILNREFEQFINDGGFPKLISYEKEQKKRITYYI